jgi:hypothetical protein
MAATVFEVATRLDVRCTKCERERDLPEADRPRYPASDERDPGAVTVTTDEACSCGATRVRIRVELDG